VRLSERRPLPKGDVRGVGSDKCITVEMHIVWLPSIFTLRPGCYAADRPLHSPPSSIFGKSQTPFNLFPVRLAAPLVSLSLLTISDEGEHPAFSPPPGPLNDQPQFRLKSRGSLHLPGRNTRPASFPRPRLDLSSMSWNRYPDPGSSQPDDFSTYLGTGASTSNPDGKPHHTACRYCWFTPRSSVQAT